MPTWEEPLAPAPPPPPPAASRPPLPEVSRPTMVSTSVDYLNSAHKTQYLLAVTRTRAKTCYRIEKLDQTNGRGSHSTCGDYIIANEYDGHTSYIPNLNKGTNYTPVNLPAPKKLVNPFERMAQQSATAKSTPPPVSSGKLTWSQRQALAKKQQEEEGERSRAASFKPLSPAGTGSRWTPPSTRAIHDSEPIDQNTPPSAPPLPSSTRPVAAPPVSTTREPEADSETFAPPVCQTYPFKVPYNAHSDFAATATSSSTTSFFRPTC